MIPGVPPWSPWCPHYNDPCSIDAVQNAALIPHSIGSRLMIPGKTTCKLMIWNHPTMILYTWPFPVPGNTENWELTIFICFSMVCETNSKRPWKMLLERRSFPFGFRPIFRGEVLLVSGSVHGKPSTTNQYPQTPWLCHQKVTTWGPRQQMTWHEPWNPDWFMTSSLYYCYPYRKLGSRIPYSKKLGWTGHCSPQIHLVGGWTSPLWVKICSSNWIMSPGIGVKIPKIIWNHHLVMCVVRSSKSIPQWWFFALPRYASQTPTVTWSQDMSNIVTSKLMFSILSFQKPGAWPVFFS